MNKHSFNIAYLDTDAVCITKQDGSPFPPEEQDALLAELNGLFPEHIKFSNDGYAPAMVVLKTKNRIYTTEKGDVKVKGSALKSSKTLPAVKKFHKRITDGLLGFTSETLPDIYRDECIKLGQGVQDIKDWASKKTISEKTIASSRKTERDIMDAVKKVHWQNGDKVWLYRTVDDKLKLVDDYSSDTPDYNLRKLLSSLANSSKVFDTVVNPEYRKDYGKTTNARSFNDMVRAKILPEKSKKPNAKNVLEAILHLLENKSDTELSFKDEYAKERMTEAMDVARSLLVTKPKTPRKTRVKKELEGSGCVEE